jgi:SAM-dependent methyltransferase
MISTLAKLQAQQLGHPSGLIGRLILAPMWNRRNSALNDVALERLALRPDDRVLEVGFGGGYLIGRMAAAVTEGRLAGVDVSQAMVDVCSKRFHALIETGRLDLQCASAESLPYPDGHFDKACTVNSIFYWPDAQQAICELSRVLEPGGRLVMCWTCPESLKGKSFSQHGLRLYQAEQVEQMMRTAGLAQVSGTRHADRHRQFWSMVGQKYA